ncbi:uncharacterized protein LOC126656891 [Mercurialis annua]|uniref:uncharacterized protein LOC126656891 n=1 Tax=Mercurialis annua TaxID=3986 RepID=UPI002160A5FA|nr:uncharacterized protein LOC126656891 [Mercurialis annua]
MLCSPVESPKDPSPSDNTSIAHINLNQTPPDNNRHKLIIKGNHGMLREENRDFEIQKSQHEKDCFDVDERAHGDLNLGEKRKNMDAFITKDTSAVIKDAQKLFEMLDGLVEEIGEENVVQVVIDSASAYVKAGDLLMEKRKKLFWSPCAAHCIDNILEDIGELLMFKDTIKKAREVCVYIYRHAWVLSMFRKFSDKKELKRAGVTRFATTFLTLKSFEENKLPLRAMFASEDWVKSQYASKPEAKRVGTIMLSDVRFWKSVKYCLKCVSPIVKVLRLVDGDAKLAMGYIYEVMDRAKEQIANNFNKQLTKYERVWKIIDTRWDLQLHMPLHAAGYFLNPK